MLHLTLALTAAFLPYQNPTWPATYNMSMSTIQMACNMSGWYDPAFGARWGICSYDWSNAKAQWANQKPMDCEERLVTQAVMTKKLNRQSNVFTYRNLVKALPWFTSVRVKLDDPAYSGWFLKFKDGANGSYHVPACTYEKCSEFYHDQEQTPEHPTPNNPHPDGACIDHCDCGKNPCGEYLWDHRNGTMLRDFLVNEFIMGPTGVGHPDIDGAFIDDYWCSSIINGTGRCNDPVQGPTEINRYSQVDMGLSDQDIADITNEWLTTMEAAQAAIVKSKGYTWSLIPGQANANAEPTILSQSGCKALLSEGCGTQKYDVAPLVMGLTMHEGNKTLPNLQEDMAAFLLMRGPYAYMGAGIWGMSWPVGAEFDPIQPVVDRPQAMDTDYGEPTSVCSQPSAGVFTREYSKASVTLDCNKFVGTIQMK